MANIKSTRSHKRRKAVPSSRFLTFPEIKGRVVELVEVDPAVESIFILFQDKTALSFAFEPGLTLYPELSEHKTGDPRPLKRWPAMHSRMSMEWP